MLEWLTDDGHQAELLAFVVYLMAFDERDVELAFRAFVRRLHCLPGEGQKQTRLVDAFAARFYHDCRAQGWWRSAAAVSALVMGMFMINTMLHNSRVARKFQFDAAAWVAHNAGRNDGADFDRGMLLDIYDNVRDCEIVFQDAPHAGTSVKHGWLSVRVAGALRTRRMWVELSDGVVHVLRAPGGSGRGAVTTLRLEGARIVRNDAAQTFSIAPAEPPHKETHFAAASTWAFTTWLAACGVRAAVAVVANPVYTGPRRGSLVEVPNPVFDPNAAPAGRSYTRASQSLNDMSPVRVLNPVFVATSARRSSFQEVENPVFGHDVAVLSPHNVLSTTLN